MPILRRRWRRRRGAGWGGCTEPCADGGTMEPQQLTSAIPEDHSRIAAFILFENGGSGSGIFIKSNKHIYFATAKHVLFNPPDYQQLTSSTAIIKSFSRDPNVSDPLIQEIILGLYNINQNIKQHKSSDCAVVRLGDIQSQGEDKYLVRNYPGCSIRNTGLSSFQLAWAPIEIFTRYQAVIPGDIIYVHGYPISLSKVNDTQIDFERPLLQKGIVAQKNKKNNTLILDTMVFPGNSGGPVIMERSKFPQVDFSVIGLAIERVFFTDSENQEGKLYYTTTYSVACPADSILDLISEFES